MVKRIFVFLFMIFILATEITQVVFASSFGGYSVQSVIPDNQVDKTKTYFDLRLEPNEKQIIQVIIRNGGDSEINAHINIHDASTGRNGIIVYQADGNNDSSVSFRTSELATVLTPNISIPAHDEIIAEIEIKMPDKEFNGCVLGGIYVTAELDGKEAIPSTENSVQMKNQYAYTIGLKLTQNDTVILPDLHLKSITSELINYRPKVSVNLQNNQPVIIKGMHIEGEIYKENSSTIFKQMEMDFVDMAPNSNFSPSIDWDGESMEAGAYRLKLRATYLNQTWEWDEMFTIEKDVANTINNASPYKAPKPIWLYSIIFILMAIILLLIIYLFKKKKPHNNAY